MPNWKLTIAVGSTPCRHFAYSTVRALLANEKQLARNLARQLAVYATGAPIRFADREPIEQILEHFSSSHYGVRNLIHELVQSELFRNK